MKSDKDISLILSGVRALIGNITPCLRSVSAEWYEDEIQFKVIFDNTATADDFELLSVAAAEIIADFSEATIKEIVQIIPPPQPTNLLKNVLYLRYEKQIENFRLMCNLPPKN